ncbi:MAG TPA: hypothetical protein VK157_01235 [Phycisphaerales bacterium]|nr:hypothetical protein [Phycisphaerales bacterium]
MNHADPLGLIAVSGDDSTYEREAWYIARNLLQTQSISGDGVVQIVRDAFARSFDLEIVARHDAELVVLANIVQEQFLYWRDF